MSDSISFTVVGMTELARIVHEARTAKGLSLEDFGALIGLAHVTVWKLEKKRQKSVQLKTLVALAPYLKYSVEELVTICTRKNLDQKQVEAARQYLIAEEILDLMYQLPHLERKRLRQLDLAVMSDEDILECLKACTDELTERLKRKG